MTDAGLRTLWGIWDLLQVDDAWAERSDRGFTWIGSRLRQYFTVTEPYEDLGMALCQIRVRAIALEQVDDWNAQAQWRLIELNRTAVGSAWFFDPETRQLCTGLSLAVHDDVVDDRIREIATYSMLQLIEAERVADSIAGVTGGSVPVASHAVSGVRTIPDDMMNLEELVAREGAEPSRFADEGDLALVAQWARKTGGRVFSAGASQAAVCVEIPHGPHDTALIELLASVRHPRLGSGLLSLTRYRPGGNLPQALAEMHALNSLPFAETSVMPLVGAWSAWPLNVHDGLDAVTWAPAFSTFTPNYMWRPGFALNEAMRAGYRAMLYDRHRYPGLPERSAEEAVHRRVLSAQPWTPSRPGDGWLPA